MWISQWTAISVMHRWTKMRAVMQHRKKVTIKTMSTSMLRSSATSKPSKTTHSHHKMNQIKEKPRTKLEAKSVSTQRSSKACSVINRGAPSLRITWWLTTLQVSLHSITSNCLSWTKNLTSWRSQLLRNPTQTLWTVPTESASSNKSSSTVP